LRCNGLTLPRTSAKWCNTAFSLYPWELYLIAFVGLPKEFLMRMIFVLLVASVLSILAFKYSDSSIGGDQILASPTQMSAMK
jgi:hypothetical protein